MKHWLLFTFAGFVFLLAVLFFVYPFMEKILYLGDTPHHADAIIVLSGDMEPYFLRTKKAVELYKNGYAPYIIFSGYGAGGDNAEFLSRIALHYHISKQAIIIEPNARTTYENFLFSKPIILKHGFKSLLIVTSPYHQLRAYLVAIKLFKGTDVMIYNCASHRPYDSGGGIKNRIKEWRFVMMEYFKLLGYYLLGRIE
jgi:uncharacterized SAM-binding protein YcdF (DUF218 family)